VEMNGVCINHDLTDGEMAAFGKQAALPRTNLWPLLVLVFNWWSFASSQIGRKLYGPVLLRFAIAVVFAVFIITWSRVYRRTFARSAELRFGPEGIFGTVDGTTFAATWSQVDRAQDVGDAVVLQIGRRRPLLVPKRAMPDARSIWDLISDKLPSKRGLIVNPNGD